MRSSPRPLLIGTAALALVGGGLAWRALAPSMPPLPPSAPAPAPLVQRNHAAPAALPILVTGVPRKPVSTTALPASLVQALGDHGTPFDARLRLVNALPVTLGAAELAAALDYVRDPAPADGLSRSQRAALKNDLINRLRAQTIPPAELTPALLALFADTGASPVLRDYALQHLGEWRSVAPPTDRSAIDTALWQAALSSEILAGTALLALCRQSEQPDAAPAQRSRIVARAHALATDVQAPLPARVTALSVAGRLDPASALPVALHIATTESGVSLLAAAVPVLRAHRDDPAAHTALQNLSAQAALPVQRLALAALR